MKLTIPVLVLQSGGPEPSYAARPLFHPEPVVRGAMLERVLARLSSELRKELRSVAQEKRLESLAAFTFCPPNLYEKTFSLELTHKKRTVRGQFLVVVLPDQRPRVAFCPQLEGVWFQFERSADLRQRTVEVLDHYYSRGPGLDAPVERAWTTDLELPFQVPATPPKEKADSMLMLLGGPPVQEGWQELERVGRALDDLYPHDLARCLGRDQALARLQRALRHKSRAPQLVVGPRKVGKTALFHQLVRSYREGKGTLTRRFWLLSPQRLISGMAYVGQWESRLLAILKHVAEKDLVLVLDDLLGLFSAGQTRDSALCVADVLKPYLQRGEVRVLAEAGAEALAVLRERDRGFADLFTITTLEETSEAQTLEIVLEEMRECERVNSCRFELESLVTIIDLQRRYIKDAAFPGKAAVFLRRIAARHRHLCVTRDKVLEFFHSTSGLALDLLDDRVALRRQSVEEAISCQVMGQPAAVAAAVDTVLVAKARLSDPSRPLASLLFVGPTGVGKTECAKALARYLFGSEDRLLRFDMNEYLQAGSAARLVGTFHQPEGLLTAAVRRRPFCVLLLDELEKAHSEVFNLLLGVLGDGRLTDARGRTVDFSQAIVVMTSNLGVREAGRSVGLRSRQAQESLVYGKAVEEFFPPEFFNRLDRVVPFGPLSRRDTQRIAAGLIDRFLAREGLLRRQCLLDVESQAMEAIVDLGFHPKLGARALKRAIESSIAVPVARRLSEMSPASPTVIRIRAEDGLRVEVLELRAADPLCPAGQESWRQADYLDEVEHLVTRVESKLVSPVGLVGEEMTPEQLWYFNQVDRLRRIRAIARRLSGMDKSRAVQRRPNQRQGRVGEKESPASCELLQAEGWRELLESRHLSFAMSELAESMPTRTSDIVKQRKLAELLAELALLEGDGAEETALLELTWLAVAKRQGTWLLGCYKALMESLELAVEVREKPGGASLLGRGPQAAAIERVERGLHLFSHGQGLALVVVGSGDRVIRVYDKAAGAVDLRTGWMCRGRPTAVDMRLLCLTAMRSPDRSVS